MKRIPLGINVALFFNLSDTIIGILSFLSIILLFVGEIVKSHIENTKAKAAHLQQKFDLFVFDMNSNIGIATDKGFKYIILQPLCSKKESNATE